MDQSIIALRTSFNCYGHLCLHVDDEAAYQEHLPFIESVANVIALSLESRAQAEQIHAAADALETRVKQRTAELEAAHAKLREQEHLISRIIDTAPTAIYIYDIASQRNVFSNQRIELILGFTPQEVQRLGPELFSRLLHPDDFAGVQQHQLRLRDAADGEILELEYRMRHADGSYRILHSWEAVFSRDEEQRPLRTVGVALDVTQDRESDAQRADLEQQVAASQRVQAIGRLAGGVAHDFNNIITVINNCAEFGLSECLDSESQHGYFEQILSAGQRAAALTQQLLAFSRKQVLHSTPISLSRVVKGMEGMLRRLIGEDIEFVANLDKNVGLARVDVARLEQVVMNLVVNARDAMPNGGRLVIETNHVCLDEQAVKTKTRFSRGDFIVLSVSDNGLGMDEATQKRLFEPFFTTKPPGHGTGLGLATAFGIIRQSGGDIGIHSVPGKGSTFEVYLPSAGEDSVELAPSAGRLKVATQSGNQTILVVDDEQSVLRIAKRILSSSGYTVLTATGAIEALSICEQHRGDVHLLLTDVVMPAMNGRELALRLRGTFPNLKVIYMSGYTADIIGDHGVIDEGMDFIAKPFSPGELQLAVQEMLSADLKLARLAP